MTKGNMVFYEIPKSSLVVIKGLDISNCLRVTLSSLKDEAKQVICHRSTEKWVQQIFGELTMTFTTFSDEKLMSERLISAPVQNIIFVDFDIYVMTQGISDSLYFLKNLKNHKKVFIACSRSYLSLPQLEKVADYCISLKSTNDESELESTSVVLNKKGSVSDEMHTITMRSTGRPTIKTQNRAKICYKTSSPDSGSTCGQTMNLPFFNARNEDGVAIRDSATKKIRIGGQVVYEPDRDDDLDDSDPDDDLNI